MIESNIIEWLDFGESAQKIEAYTNKNLLKVFGLFRELLRNRFPVIFDIIFLIIYFLQLLCISIFFESYNKDFILEILNYLKNFLIPSNLINNNNYIKFIASINTIIYLDIFLMVVILFTVKKINLNIFVYIINLINMIIFYYLEGPILDIGMIIFWCEDGKHKFLEVECFKSSLHIVNIIFSILLFLLIIFIASLYSFFFNKLGSIVSDISETADSIKCNYEIFSLIIKIIIFCFYVLIRSKVNNNIIKLIYVVVIFILSIFMSIYTYKFVYYYNNIINYIISLGWIFSSWFSLCIILKFLFKIDCISPAIIIGWVIIYILLYKLDKMKTLSLLTETNILELKDMKSIEIYNNILLDLLSKKNNFSSRILIYGIIKNFEEYINSNPEANFHYQKLLNDNYLNKKFNHEFELPLLAIIYIIYFNQLEKSSFKEEIAISMSYFLINKLNNPTFAILLSSKIKDNGINIYYKYLLTEDIKEHLVKKLVNNNKNSIKHVQIGSIILYYLYLDLFRLKIYDGITNQIDFFDILRNNITTKKSTENLLKTGTNILTIRKEILKIWKQIVEINPFSDESYKDYMLYLDTILQDDILVREESKKYTLLKGNKDDEKYNIYHKMFLADTSSILLIDGYLSIGKILYASPNFSLVFTYNSKELLNFTIDDLLPNVIQSFHKELIDEAIKYSNMNYRFKRQINSLLKNKNGGLFNIKLYVKAVPNISYGLIFFAFLQKNFNSNFVIVLDKDLKIHGFTEMGNNGSPFTFEIGYNLSHALFGYHIGLIIPDILPLIEFKNDEFIIVKRDLELKGYLYQINNLNEIKVKVDNVLNKIKSTKINNNSPKYFEDSFQNVKEEFNELISNLNNQKIKPFSIFFKVQMFSFLDDKHKYYKIIIMDDIITGNEGQQIIKKEFDKSKIYKDSDYIEDKSYNSKIIEEKNKKIKKNKEIKIDKQILKNNINENEINENKKKNVDSLDNKEDIIDNINNKEKDKLNINNKNNTSLSPNLENIKDDKIFNKIKIDVINNKEGTQIKIFKVLNLLFGVITMTFITCDYIIFKKYFNHIQDLLFSNVLFNLTKISVGSLYLMTTNIKFEIHNCLLPSHNSFLYSFLYTRIIGLDIDYLLKIRNYTNNFPSEFNKILEQKHNVYLNVYGTNEIEFLELNFDNYILYLINSGINLLNYYPVLVQLSKQTSNSNLDPLSFGYNEIIDFEKQSYFYFYSDLNGFSTEELRKKIEGVSEFYPIICNGGLLFIIFILYSVTISSIHNSVIFFLERLINFNSTNFDNYLKNLEEIKKKLQNDNINEEEEKDEMDINDSEMNNSKKDEENDKNDLKDTKLNKKKKKSKKRISTKDGKAIKQKQNKMKIMSIYFITKSLTLGIVILILIIISLSYYILSLLYEIKTKKNILEFDSINNDIIGVFKESFKIFIDIRQELTKFEDTLIRCQPTENNTYYINLPTFSEITVPTFKNTIIQIKSDFGFKGKNLENFTLLFIENACEALFGQKPEYNFCGLYAGDILYKGMEQALSKINTKLTSQGEIYNSVNENRTSFQKIYNENHLEDLFTQYIYQKAASSSDEIFDALRVEKLAQMFLMMKIVFIIYLTLVFLSVLLLFYLIHNYHILIISSLYFIGIFPLKYLVEDEKFYNEIIVFGKKFF